MPDPEEIFTINMNGAPLSARALAMIATHLELHGSIKVKNVATGLPGHAAFEFGLQFQKFMDVQMSKTEVE